MVNGLSFALDVLGLCLNVNSWVKKNYENLIYGVQPEEIKDTKVVIRIRKSKKDRQHNGHNKKDKNYLQKTKDRTTRTPLQPEGEQRCSGKVSSSCSTSDTRHVTVK